MQNQICHKKALFGEIAIDLGYLTEGELSEVLQIQKSLQESKSLGRICIEKGILAEENVNNILQIQFDELCRSFSIRESQPGMGAEYKTAHSGVSAQINTSPASVVDAPISASLLVQFGIMCRVFFFYVLPVFMTGQFLMGLYLLCRSISN